jgi:hypothetical protein
MLLMLLMLWGFNVYASFYPLSKMSIKPAFFAQVVDYIETRHRRLYRDTVCYLICTKSTLIPLFSHQVCQVLLYKPNKFQLDNYTNDWCIEHLRFSQQEIKEILSYLRLDLCQWQNRYYPSPEAVFCLLLYKLSWPHRYKDSLDLFRQSPV